MRNVMTAKGFLLLGALFGMLAVILGAFGAHGLEKFLTEPMLQRYHTGVDYHFYHALALVLVALLLKNHHQRFLTYAGIAFSIGILLFSGSLYSYAITGIRSFAVLTPFGGLAFILGWLFIFIAAWRKNKLE